VQRTLVDLAGVLPELELARAVHEADVRHHIAPDQVEAVLGRRHNWSGAGKLRRVIWGEVPVTLSRLESRFLHFVRAASLTQPEVNRRVNNRYLDCRWPDHRLTVEFDGYRYTAAATPGSRTASGSATHARAGTSSGATPGSTSTRTRRR
jgi:hypothetical protein